MKITDGLLELTKKEAKRISRRHKVPPDEALSSAYFALVNSARLFCPMRGASFEGYLINAIRWQSFTDYKAKTKYQQKTTVLNDDISYLPIAEKLLLAKEALFKVVNGGREPGAGKIPQETQLKIIEGYLHRGTARGIAKEVGISRTAVWRILKPYKEKANERHG